VSCLEGIFGKHFAESLLVSTPHAASQLCPKLLIFQIRVPSEAQSSSVDMAMLLINPLSPGAKIGVKETWSGSVDRI
jgi:hypothetical protein